MVSNVFSVVLFISRILEVDLSIYPTGAILVRGSYSRCKDIVLHKESIVCEIHNQEDERKIEGFGLSGCYGSTLSCPEGDIKTCMPLMTISVLHYQCFCHFIETDTPVENKYYWSDWILLEEHFRVFRYKRQLMVDNGGTSLVDEYSRIYDPVIYIVANTSLSPEIVYSASSQHNTVHQPAKAHLDYFGNSCSSWAAGSDPNPWLKISLPTSFSVLGVYIMQRCDRLQYPTVVDVTTSTDDVTWHDVVIAEDIESRYSSYDNYGSVSIWFPTRLESQYWKIFIVSYVAYPSMRCDLIGHPVLYIVANTSLSPETVYSASSQYSTAYPPERARIDYIGGYCSWAAATADTQNPWLKISLPIPYAVIGVFIMQRCDYKQYATVVDLRTSTDDATWQDVVIAEDISTRYSSYDNYGSVSIWFSTTFTTRYWKVYIVSYVGYPSIKCDLLGYYA